MLIKKHIPVILIVMVLSVVCATKVNAVTLGTSNAATLTQGLVGYWSLDGNKINWLTGKVFDASSSGSTAQLVAMSTTTSPVPGKIGGALNFNGGTTNVTTSYGTALHTVTISVWIYPRSLGASSLGRIIDKNQSGTDSMRLFTNTSNSLAFVRDDTGGNHGWVTGNNSIVLNKWQHVVVTFDDSTFTNDATIYINGVRQSVTPTFSGSAPFIDTAQNFVIGNRGGQDRGFDGYIDDVLLYNRVLSSIEANQLYKTGSVKVGSSNATSLNTGLAGYWPLDGSKTSWVSGLTQDLSGQGNPGQLIGMSTSTSPVVGKVGGALSFTNYSKSLQYIDAGASTALRFTSGVFSASTWVYSTSTSQQFFFLHGLGCSTFASWYLSIGGNENGGVTNKYTFGFSVANAGATNLVSSVPNTTTGKWMHLVGTYDGVSKLSLYINGVLNNTATVSGVPYASTEKLYMGQDPGCGGRFRVAGMLDDMRVYSRTLSAQEVRQLYGTGLVNIAHSNPSVGGSGLVGNWTFDGSKLNWATGKVLDSSGLGNTGQMINLSTSTSVAVGKMGQAIKFNGSSSYVTVSGSTLPTGSSIPFTVSAWAKSQDDQSGVVYIAEWGNAAHTGNVTLLGLTSSWRFGVFAGCAIDISRSTDANKWVHLVGTYDGTNARLYKNGMLAGGPTACSPNISTQLLGIGAQNDGTNVFNGPMDDVRIYNRALSDQQVNQLYSSGR